ncbi:MAG: uracil-DNA glycosylase [Chloroflexi bacterium]|nr:uracil-DNA glycosylase [Chloroflexota bacterium]|tara:strand:- start:5506 stop:6090 length:585 start_codon:yes stop_codon:yes gene_type:complete
MSFKDFISKINYLDSSIKTCTLCDLHKTRNLSVPGSGTGFSGLMMVGEGPGFNEDKEGLPFVGRAGKLLDKLLSEISITRKDIFITNIVKCRPPNNRDPLPNELEFCSPYLEKQIKIFNPRVIVTLGRFSLSYFLPNKTISSVRGQQIELDGRIIYPVYHPAAGLRNSKFSEILRKDLHLIPSLLVSSLENKKC